jgi:hypothetical protein
MGPDPAGGGANQLTKPHWKIEITALLVVQLARRPLPPAERTSREAITAVTLKPFVIKKPSSSD